MVEHPYKSLPDPAFWRKAVADKGMFGYADLWSSGWDLPPDTGFATFGSCFAQHIKGALVRREKNWINTEPAPELISEADAKRFNYGIFTCRTANIYTTPQLLAWCELAANPKRAAEVELWIDPETGRARDVLRPAIEPDGFLSTEEATTCLQSTAQSFRKAIQTAGVFVFTLGLTEGWESSETGQIYAVCPGVLGGRFDPAKHVFRNYSYPQTLAALEKAYAIMKSLNPDLRLLLTVSPVPLVATASGDHVLVATQYSKSTLRAVAGDMAQAHADVQYFPSYEIVAGHPTRAAFFEPNLRSVALHGVDFVMEHFFSGITLGAQADAQAARRPKIAAPVVVETAFQKSLREELAAEELACEEMHLDQGHG